jgi:hypothetical protein
MGPEVDMSQQRYAEILRRSFTNIRQLQEAPHLRADIQQET